MKTTPSTASTPSRRGLLQLLAGGATLAGGALLFQNLAHSAEEAVVIPPPAQDLPAGNAKLEKAIFAGGCFWGVQGVFQHVQGVQKAVSGYSGGSAATATYSLVSSGRTAHAESVEISYDPAQVSYGALLQIFFSVVHDPTQLNRQGPDSGTQYRSAIFAASPEQEKVARAYIAQLDALKVFKKPIATRIESGPSFFAAEAYHQDFLTENPRHPYIVVNDLPKVAHLKRLFAARYRAEPALVKRAA